MNSKNKNRKWKPSCEDPIYSDRNYIVSLSGIIRISYYYKDSSGSHWSDVNNPWDNAFTEHITFWSEIDLPPDGRGTYE